MRTVTWASLDDWKGGNKNGSGGWINWFINNYCAYCPNLWPKGYYRCPDCHRRLRICPRTNHVENRILFKKAHLEAASKLKAEGWKLPPMRVSCKRWN